MKKTIILMLSVTLSFSSCYVLKEIPKEDLNQSKIIENLNQSKDDLYVKANQWMIKVFKNAESVIQFSDKDSGTLSGKYLVFGELTYLGSTPIDKRVFATINVSLKENRAKIDVNVIQGSKGADFQIIEMKQNISNLIDDFEASIKENKKDW